MPASKRQIATFARYFNTNRANRFADKARNAEKSSVLKHTTAPMIKRGKMACKA